MLVDMLVNMLVNRLMSRLWLLLQAPDAGLGLQVRDISRVLVFLISSTFGFVC
jgi:hypothetical protein